MQLQVAPVKQIISKHWPQQRKALINGDLNKSVSSKYGSLQLSFSSSGQYEHPIYDQLVYEYLRLQLSTLHTSSGHD